MTSTRFTGPFGGPLRFRIYGTSAGGRCAPTVRAWSHRHAAAQYARSSSLVELKRLTKKSEGGDPRCRRFYVNGGPDNWENGGHRISVLAVD